MNSVFFFVIHEAIRQTQYQSYRQLKDDKMEMKSKSYLRIIFLINYMMEESLLVKVVSSFTVFCQKKCHKKEKEREWHPDGLMSQVQVLPVFYPEVPFTTVC